MTDNTYLLGAMFCFDRGWETEMYLNLLWWAEANGPYDCDDLGLCNGPNERHDCVDCPKKRW